MKKLLITTMAAVSVGLCAKAEYDGTKTSFEDYDAGSTLTVSTNDEGDRTWTSSATDPLFVISNKTDFANWTKPSRPDYWATSSDENALTIDTDAPLFCHVNNRNTSYDFSDGPIFFDSVVQFTATDVAAEPDSDDKLRVWLYSSPEDVATTPGLFNETTPKKCLVVTAGSYDGADGLMGNLTHQHYEITGIDVQPDTWHRLTIKAIADINASDFNTPGFEIWVDGTPVTYGEDKKTQFPSLKRAVASETLQCVAFDGKGAVDDIVFTTTAPEFTKEPEAQKFVVTLNYESSDKWTFQNFTIGTASVTASNGGTYEIPIGAEFSILLSVESGYTLSIQEDIELLIPTIDQRGRHILTFTPTAVGTGTITITAVSTGGGSGEESEDPAKPTIGGNSYETEAALKAVVKSGTEITVPSNWTVDGKVLKDDKGATFATFEYYNLALADGIVTATLDQKAAAPFAEATDLEDGEEVLEVGEDVSGNPELTVRIKPYVGLYYGAMTGTALDNLTLTTDYQKATSTDVIEFTATGKAGDTASFIKIVVTDIAPEATEK